MIRRKRPNSSASFGKKPLQFPAKTSFFGLHLILAIKHFNFRQKPFFGLHSISATELRNLHLSTFACQMHLVKAAKASPHAKFYNLSTEFTHQQPQGRFTSLKKNYSIKKVVLISHWSKIIIKFCRSVLIIIS